MSKPKAFRFNISDGIYNSIDESKLDPIFPGEKNTNSTDVYKPDLPARPSSQTTETLPSPPSNFPKASEQSPIPLRPLPVYVVPGTIKYTASNTASGNNQHILIKGIPDCMSIEDIANHVEIDIIAVEDGIDTIKVNRIDKEAAVTLKNVKGTSIYLFVLFTFHVNHVQSPSRFKKI